MKNNTAKLSVASIIIAIVSFLSISESKAEGAYLGVNGYLTTINVTCSCKAMVYKITSVQSGSPAAMAGVRPGDVIFKANNTRVDNYSKLAMMRNMLAQGSLSLHCFAQGSYYQPAYYHLNGGSPTTTTVSTR